MFTSSTRTVRTTFRWIVLLPVLMVGSLVYWSVALGLGGLSLMAASAFSITSDAPLGIAQVEQLSETGGQGAALDVADGTTPIMVRLEESEEPEDVNDNVGAAGFTQVTDDQQAVIAPGPGSTSY
jgi:hypothetical protein